MSKERKKYAVLSISFKYREKLRVLAKEQRRTMKGCVESIIEEKSKLLKEAQKNVN